MCLIAFAIDSHPLYRLVLVANRDEFRHRATLPADFWLDAPHVLAGRDGQAGGSWIGITRGGRLAAVTNYRDKRQQVINPPSRGLLVAGYLRDTGMSTERFTAELQRNATTYDGFNLMYGSCDSLWYFTNRGGSSGKVGPGVHALSNHLLDTSWPKVVAARQRLTACLEYPSIDPMDLLELLADPTPFADELLPDTGIGPEYERFLSPLFIRGEQYATRSTTVIVVRRDGRVRYLEQNHDDPAVPLRNFEFSLAPDVSQ